jgi:hypothetical protein
MAKQPSGIASKDNLRDWADYAKSHSVEYDPIKSQSKEDLAPCGTYSRDNDYVISQQFGDWQVVPDKAKYEDRGFKHWSEVSKRNSYTGPNGTHRKGDGSE